MLVSEVRRQHAKTRRRRSAAFANKTRNKRFRHGGAGALPSAGESRRSRSTDLCRKHRPATRQQDDEHADELREELRRTRLALSDYADLLAKVVEIDPLRWPRA